MRIRKRKPSIVAVDTETTGLMPWHGDVPFAIVFYYPSGDYVYFEWEVDPFTRIPSPSKDELEYCRRVLGDASIEKVFHNAIFDIRMMQRAYGIETRGVIHDTMWSAHSANSMESSLKLKDLASKYLGIPKDDEDALKKATIAARREGKKRGWSLGGRYHYKAGGERAWESEVEADYWMPRALDPESDVCETYCVMDGERTMKLHEVLQYGLDQVEQRFVYEKEQKLFEVNWVMQSRGVRIDVDVIQSEVHKLEEKHDTLLKTLCDEAWNTFNPNSHQEVSRWLDERGVPIKERTATGKIKVSADVLKRYRGNHLVDTLMSYRSVHQGLNTFFLRFYSLRVEEPDGSFAIHPEFKQVGPRTGRFSCANPNLQNVTDVNATRGFSPVEARKPFGPRPGCIWLCIDYEQLEVRIFADLSRESEMIRAINEGENIHDACTNKAWGGDQPRAWKAAFSSLEMDGSGSWENEEIKKVWKKLGISKSTEAQYSHAREWLSWFDFDIVKAEASVGKKVSRAKAKMLLFLKIFGGGPRALSDFMECTYDEAVEFLGDYDAAFPRISQFMREEETKAIKKGYVVDRFGRKLRVDPQKLYRCVNYQVQGSAASLMKKALIETWEYLCKKRVDAVPVLTIHDEIVFEFSRTALTRRVARTLCDIMADHGGAFGIDTPVDADIVRESWNVKEKAKLWGEA